MLRLFALLLVCLVLPVRALTLTPVAGSYATLGARLAAGWRLPRQRAPWAPAAHRRGWQPPCGLRPAAPRRHGPGGLLDLALDSDGWLYLSYSEPGTGRRHRRGPGPAAKTPSSTGNCCFAKSPRWLAAPISALAWC